MSGPAGNGQTPARTLLEAKIRERNMSYEEFAEYATTYAREHGEPGTLSARQLQRLLSPRPDSPARPRPATRRLLEQIFTTPADVLLAPPPAPAANTEDGIGDWQRQVANLNRDIVAAQRVDPDTLTLFSTQLDTTRRLDRRFGAASLLDPLRLQIDHVETLFTHATSNGTVRALAGLLAEAHALAAWQSLDRGQLTDAWRHSRRACDAARAAESPAMLAHAIGEQTVILADVGRTAQSAELAEHARNVGARSSALLRSWLAAAHGEALAADGRQDACLRAFDDAAQVFLKHSVPDGGEPYVALDAGHLARWRGHALARFGHPDAVSVLRDAMTVHDAEFSRAEAALRTDLAFACLASDDRDAAVRHHAQAYAVADGVGSVRQTRRLEDLRSRVS